MLKKIFISLAVIFLLLPQMAGAETYEEEKIREYDVKIEINQDATLNVEEKIVYDFASLSDRHGIYRDIPIKYGKSLSAPRLKISGVKVADEKGAAQPFTQTISNSFLHLKIGDLAVTVSGIKTYVISYQVKGALSFFESFDELYWNAIGTDWTVPIYNPEIQVILPKSVSQNDLRISCYVGSLGSNDSCSRQLVFFDGQNVSGVIFKFSSVLSPKSGLTVAIGWPKNLVAYPTQGEKFLNLLSIYGYLVIPLLVFIIMFRLWWKKGRDPKGRGVIVAEFEPPKGFTPAETNALLHERCGLKEISAEIIQLAIQGHLKIKQIEKDKLIGKDIGYELDDLNKDQVGLKSYQVAILGGLFNGRKTRRLDEKDEKFYEALVEARRGVLVSLVEGGYIKKNPRTVKLVYTIIAAILIFLFIPLVEFIGVIGILSLFVTGVIVLFFGLAMPAKTQAGVYAKEHILGFKKYLEVAEKDRLEFHNAPEKSPEVFEKFLPFAIALGVEKQWAKQFEGLYTTPPSWYEGGSFAHGFNTAIFVSSLSSFSSATSAAYGASAPHGGSGSGGGGFSGGGFGGGGGGSW